MMKAITLFAAASILCCTALAQPRLTLEGAPQIGDSAYFRYDSPTPIPDIGPSGAHGTYDYSELPGPSWTREAYIEPEDGSEGSSFPEATICKKRWAGNNWSYYEYQQQVGNELQVIGSHNPGNLRVFYDNPKTVMTFPFDYSDSFSDDWHWTASTDDMNYEELYGTRVTTFDGYGTLITPEGTYENAIRVYTYENTDWTKYQDGVVTAQESRGIELFEWYIPGQGTRVLYLKRTVRPIWAIWDNGYDPDPLYIPVGIEDERENQLPTVQWQQGQVVLNATEAGNAQLLSLSGQQVMNQRLTPGTNYLNTAELAPGMYLLHLHTGAAMRTEKVVIAAR